MHGSLEMRETLEHRNYVANAAPFSTGAAVFNMMYELGLQPHHTLVDVGCGSLRVGRFLIMYLENGNYAGIDPNVEILNAGIDKEVTQALCDFKEARFSHTTDYYWAPRKFDWVLISGVLVHKCHSEIKKALDAAYDMLKPYGFCVVDYYPSWPHWEEDYNPVYPQIAPHGMMCLTQVHPGLSWTGFDKELFGAHYIQLIKNG